MCLISIHAAQAQANYVAGSLYPPPLPLGPPVRLGLSVAMAMASYVAGSPVPLPLPPVCVLVPLIPLDQNAYVWARVF